MALSRLVGKRLPIQNILFFICIFAKHFAYLNSIYLILYGYQMDTIRKIRFKNRKGAEIPFSTGAWNKTPAYFCEDVAPYRTDCYEVIFFHEVEGKVCLDGVPIVLQNHTMLFIAPQRKRRWNISNPRLNAQFLRFQEDFVHDLLVDKTFLDRLDCFFKPQVPLFMQPDGKAYQKINDACFDIWREMDNYQPDSLHIVRSLVYFIATTANRAYVETYGRKSCLRQLRASLQTFAGGTYPK
jgi:hypothetical protein